MNVKEDIRLDLNNLDTEWADLPDQFHKYSEEGDLLDSEIKIKKLQLEILEANLDLKIRANPKTFQIDKLTETIVKSTIRADLKWQEESLEILELEKQRKLMASACRALEMKRDALKNIQSLYLSEFYVAPSDPEKKQERELRVEEMAKRNVRTEMKKFYRRKQKTENQEIENEK